MPRRVLLVYYSFTNQTRRVADAMGAAFEQVDWEVVRCEIELTDPRYRIEFPLRPFWRRLLSWIPAQVSGRTGEIDFPREVLGEPYDLVCIGSPTWWLNPALPIVSFLKCDAARDLLDGRPVAVFAVCRAFWSYNVQRVRRLATSQGATFLAAQGFGFRGHQLQTFASFVNYAKTGEDRPRYWGMNIHPFGVTDEGLDRAGDFARELATRIETVSPREE